MLGSNLLHYTEDVFGTPLTVTFRKATSIEEIEYRKSIVEWQEDRKGRSHPVFDEENAKVQLFDLCALSIKGMYNAAPGNEKPEPVEFDWPSKPIPQTDIERIGAGMGLHAKDISILNLIPVTFKINAVRFCFDGLGTMDGDLKKK